MIGNNVAASHRAEADLTYGIVRTGEIVPVNIGMNRNYGDCRDGPGTFGELYYAKDTIKNKRS